MKNTKMTKTTINGIEYKFNVTVDYENVPVAKIYEKATSAIIIDIQRILRKCTTPTLQEISDSENGYVVHFNQRDSLPKSRNEHISDVAETLAGFTDDEKRAIMIKAGILPAENVEPETTNDYDNI